ncbi:hypothetical protein CMO84_07020 [Candidatus Woesearchaeota archaeon]|jgi:hypothetical protein|nr:hypothetical protein [Candidatus Woesearchaeota archaeon]MDP6939415.1 C25 family cysteine peptidase [Planctomycetota bacterium]
MKHSNLAAITLLALLTGTPGLGQDNNFTNFTRGQGRSGTGLTRKPPTELDLTLITRNHIIEKHPTDDPVYKAYIVHEDYQGPESEGAHFSPRTGLPELGMRQVDVLLPYEADFRTLDLQILGEKTQFLGNIEIGPVGIAESGLGDDQSNFTTVEFVPDGVQLDDVGRDMAVYGANQDWPLNALEISEIAQHRALRYVRIEYRPFRWNPVTKALVKVTQLQARLTWDTRSVSDQKRDLELGDPVPLQDMDPQRFLNGKSGIPWYQHPKRPTITDYLIITSDDTYMNSLELWKFMLQKAKQGHSVEVKTVEWIETYFPSTASTGRRVDSIRKFLRSDVGYQHMGLKYLLLVGDPDPDDQGDVFDSVGDVPMLMTWPGGKFTRSAATHEDELEYAIRFAPTDSCYGELSYANWDLDGDGFPGERKDDRRKIGVGKWRYATDFDMEIKVGRIPFGAEVNEQTKTISTTRLDDFLAELIRYETDPMDADLRSARRTVFLAMGEYRKGEFMQRNGEALVEELGTVFDPVEMYQSTPYDYELTNFFLRSIWDGMEVKYRNGAGLVWWSGHGSFKESILNTDPSTWPNDWMDTAQGHVINWNDPGYISSNPSLQTRSIVITGACLNANPEFDGANRYCPSKDPVDNLIYRTLDDVAVGAFANTSASNDMHPRTKGSIGKKSYSSDIAYSLATHLANGCRLGVALAKVRRRGDFTGAGGNIASLKAHNLLIMNLFGDPSMRYIID